MHVLPRDAPQLGQRQPLRTSAAGPNPRLTRTGRLGHLREPGRGELCVEVQSLQGVPSPASGDAAAHSRGWQRESSATIRAPAASYRQASPPTRQSVVEFDCRGLELMEFKADVGALCSTPVAGWVSADDGRAGRVDGERARVGYGLWGD